MLPSGELAEGSSESSPSMVSSEAIATPFFFLEAVLGVFGALLWGFGPLLGVLGREVDVEALVAGS